MSIKRTLTHGLAATATLAVAGAWTAPAQACSGSEPLLGGACIFAGNFNPRGYALMQGQLLAISQNDALFSILGTTYGGDGRTTFALPDTRGRVVIGPGQGPGLSNYPLGAKGGAERVTLGTNQMPAHNHSGSVTGALTTMTLMANAANGNQNGPGGNSLAANNRDSDYQTGAPDVDMGSGAITTETTVVQAMSGPAGGGQSHNNMQPYLTVNYVMATVGIYPSRN